MTHPIPTRAESLAPNQQLESNLRALATNPAVAIEAFGIEWAGRCAQSALDALAPTGAAAEPPTATPPARAWAWLPSEAWGQWEVSLDPERGALARQHGLRVVEFAALAYPAATAVCVPAEMRHAGAALSNCAFNLAQRAGSVLTAQEAETLDRCRRNWDRALSASPAASTAGATPETTETSGVSLRAGLSVPLRSTAIPDATGNGLSVNPNTEN